MNLAEVQVIFERAEPMVKKSNNRFWITFTLVGIIALCAVIVVSQSESGKVSVEGDQL